MRAQAWLAADGGVLREQGTLGFTLERQSRAQARRRGRDLRPRRPGRDHTHPGRRAHRGAARDTAAHAAHGRGRRAASIPNDPPRQRVAARTAADRARDGAGRPRARRVDDRGRALPRPRAVHRVGRRRDRRDGARASSARERDAATAARALVDWVHEHLEQEPSVTVPSAREVLAARRGDCNEHAVLLTALARAAGIPARVVAGVVYLEDGFYYHAWNELWLGALGQRRRRVRADAGRRDAREAARGRPRAAPRARRGGRPARVHRGGDRSMIRFDRAQQDVRLRSSPSTTSSFDDRGRRRSSASSAANGAGKTTTIRMMMGLLAPTVGHRRPRRPRHRAASPRRRRR